MSLDPEDRQWLEGRLNTMEDRLGKRIDDTHQVATARLNDHSKRIRALEIHRGYVAGVGAGLGFAMSWVRDLITGRG